MRIGNQALEGLESSLIQQLRIGENVSRVQLARRLNLAPSTIGQYVDRLIGDGFLREGHKSVRPAGRPPTVLELNPGAGQFVGLDFEARQILAVVVDFAQKPLRQQQVPLRSSDDAERVLEKIEQTVDSLLEGDHPLLGIGVGVPGAVDRKRGIGLHYEYIRNWRAVPLGERLSQRFGVPVSLENNIRAMASAEQLFGQGRGVRNFICIGIRTGVGAGLIVNGRLHSGPQNLAGEIGGWPCDDGQELEQLVSLRAIGERIADSLRSGRDSLVRLKRNRVLTEDWLCAAQVGDRLVLDVLGQAAHVLGKVIAQLNLVLNPERVIIAGPLGELKDAFVHPVIATVEPMTRSPHSTTPIVTGSQLGDFNGALGGAALAVQRWTPIRTDS